LTTTGSCAKKVLSRLENKKTFIEVGATKGTQNWHVVGSKPQAATVTQNTNLPKTHK
jgi:hypothetical protein